MPPWANTNTVSTLSELSNRHKHSESGRQLIVHKIGASCLLLSYLVIVHQDKVTAATSSVGRSETTSYVYTDSDDHSDGAGSHCASGADSFGNSQQGALPRGFSPKLLRHACQGLRIG